MISHNLLSIIFYFYIDDSYTVFGFCLACDESRGRRDIGIAFPTAAAAAAAASTFDVRVFAHIY